MKFFLAQIAITALAQDDSFDALLDRVNYHEAGEPIQVKIAMSSDCPYTQEFVPRHLIKLMKADIPQDVKIYTAFDPETSVNKEGKVCTNTGPPHSVVQQTCLANIAIGCAFHSTVMDLSHDVQVDFLEQLINRFQQAPFNDDRKNPQLYESVVEGVNGLDLDAMKTCIADEGQKIGTMMHEHYLELRKEAKRQYGHSVNQKNPNMHGMFPWIFLEGTYLIVEHGILLLPNQESLVEMACKISPNAPACAVETEQLFDVTPFHHFLRTTSVVFPIMITAGLMYALITQVIFFFGRSREDSRETQLLSDVEASAPPSGTE